jgi:uncharacterized membrane protein YgcG
MSESDNTVSYLADAARRRGSRDPSVGPVEPDPTRSGGRRARAGFDGAQGFANRMLGDQDEHHGGPPGREAKPSLDEQIDGALRRAQTRRRVTKLPMSPSAHTAGITAEANGTLTASPPRAVRRNRPRVKVARKRRISGRGWGRMMVAVTMAAAVLVGLVIAKPGHSGSSGQPILARSGTAAVVSYERHGSSAVTFSFLKQEAQAQARAAARRDHAIKRRHAQELSRQRAEAAAARQRAREQAAASKPASASEPTQATTAPQTITTPAYTPTTTTPTYTPTTTTPTYTPTYTPSGGSAGGNSSSSSSGGGSQSGSPPCEIGALGCG